MFVFKNALVKERVERSNRIEKDISQETMIDIHTNYIEVILVLTNSLYEDDLYVNIKDIEDHLKHRTSSETLLEFLIRIDNAGLPLIPKEELKEKSTVHWIDGFKAGYDIDLVRRAVAFDTPLHRTDKNDLRIYKAGVDPKHLYDNMLVTVNGLLHRTNFAGDSLHVLDGGLSNRTANRNTLGMLYFGALGGVQQVNIRKRDISNGLRNQPLSEAVFLSVNKDIDLSEKSVMLSMGGYLLIPGSDGFNRVGEGLYKLDLRNQPVLQRFLDARTRSCLGCIETNLTTSPNNPNQIALEEFNSDEFIIELLTQLNSFFIVINTPNVSYKKHNLEFGDLPGKYVYKERPTLPLITGLGNISEYWYRKELDRYSLSIQDTLNPNYQFETTGWKTATSVDNSKITNNQNDYSKGFLLEIYSV